MLRFLLVMLSVFYVSPVFALDMKEVIDNESVAAKISAIDITRLVIRGDRIKNIKGVIGTYTHENDKNSGEVYIQPTSSFQHAAFTILVESEQGLHFTLLLDPIDVPGGTLMLVPKKIEITEREEAKQASNYELTLTRLMRAMRLQKTLAGYTKHTVDDAKLYTMGSMTSLHLKTVYQGSTFQGQLFELTNSSSQIWALDERQFLGARTRAVSLEYSSLAPQQTVTVLRVISHA
jgi:type-F conjugative transfer system secretin TraK